ncbi:MAG: hypothetical protein GY765_34170, partial [bacterium]|nr:hypothetical protein [bacterium]
MRKRTAESILISLLLCVLGFLLQLPLLAGRPPAGNMCKSRDFMHPGSWPEGDTPDMRSRYLVPINIVRIYSDEHGADEIAPGKWLYAQVEVMNRLFRFSSAEMREYGNSKAPCLQFKIHGYYDVHEKEVSEILGKPFDTESVYGDTGTENSRNKVGTRQLRSLKVTGALEYLTVYCVWSLKDPDEYLSEFGGESNIGFADRLRSGPRRKLTKVTSRRAIMGVCCARQAGSWMSTLAHEVGHYFGLPHAWEKNSNVQRGIRNLDGVQGKVDPDPFYANVMDYDNGPGIVHYFSKSQLAFMFKFASQRAPQFIKILETADMGTATKPPVVSMEPQAVINRVWVPETSGGDSVKVHVDFKVDHMLKAEGQLVAWFYDASGVNLVDSDGQYNSINGQVSVGTPFTPAYKNTVYADLALTLPAGQLHLPPGRFKLAVMVGVFKGGSMLASSQTVNFNYTVPGAPQDIREHGAAAAWISSITVSPKVAYNGEDWVRI